MRPQFLAMIGWVGALALLLVACGTPNRGEWDQGTLPPEQLVLGSLAANYPNFRTLEEIRATVHPLGDTDGVYVFEKGDIKVAVRIETWGSGESWNGVSLFSYDAARQQWVHRALWDTETRGVRVSFDQKTGTICVRSGKGRRIFECNISVLAAENSRDW